MFCVGILLSRHPVYISWRWISLGVILFVLSLFNRYLWVVSPILALFPVAAVLPLARKEPLQNVLLFMGKLSAALFVTHAFVRQQVLAHVSFPRISGLLYLLLCIVVAWVYRLCLTCFIKDSFVIMSLFFHQTTFILPSFRIALDREKKGNCQAHRRCSQVSKSTEKSRFLRKA